MSRVKGKDTSLELAVRSELHRLGLRFRKHYEALPGKPDVAFVRARLAVFLDGDFWHGRKFASWKGKLSEFWLAKITRNRKRDESNRRKIRKMGWSVVRIWEHDAKADLAGALETILNALAKAAAARGAPAPPLETFKALPRPTWKAAKKGKSKPRAQAKAKPADKPKPKAPVRAREQGPAKAPPKGKAGTAGKGKAGTAGKGEAGTVGEGKALADSEAKNPVKKGRAVKGQGGASRKATPASGKAATVAAPGGVHASVAGEGAPPTARAEDGHPLPASAVKEAPAAGPEAGAEKDTEKPQPSTTPPMD
jgi:DNA mismatch endonuclease (patch repair protein)